MLVWTFVANLQEEKCFSFSSQVRLKLNTQDSKPESLQLPPVAWVFVGLFGFFSWDNCCTGHRKSFPVCKWLLPDGRSKPGAIISEVIWYMYISLVRTTALRIANASTSNVISYHRLIIFTSLRVLRTSLVLTEEADKSHGTCPCNCLKREKTLFRLLQQRFFDSRVFV